MRPVKIRIYSFILGLVIFLTMISRCQAFVYTIKTNVNMRNGPGVNYDHICKLPHNQTLFQVKKLQGWVQVKTRSGNAGFVRQDMISDIWIKVYKKERKLYVIQGEDKILEQYPIALSSFNPLGDKQVLGDGGTPEGRFFICEMIKHPKKPKYGARSMRISYPNIEDARRGLKDKLITMGRYRPIVENIHNRKMPDQNTQLGGSIRIHGGGSANDWTLGCMGLDDCDIKELFAYIKNGFRVEIYKSAGHDREVNEPGFLNNAVLQGAKQQLKHPALYTRSATQVVSLAYPGGDIPTGEAVCTDIVIRALRYAAIDLQAMVYEDAFLSPKAYVPEIKTPNYHIDHRRVRTLKKYFDRHCINLSETPDKVRPGDIVIMDTGIANGTECDHIGIVSDIRDDSGNYAVINIWSVGATTACMRLIGLPYPEVVYYYRLTRLMDYDAI